MNEPLTTEELRDTFILTHTRNHDSYMTGIPLADIRGQYADLFDDWLAAHDAEVRAEVLEQQDIERALDGDWEST